MEEKVFEEEISIRDLFLVIKNRYKVIVLITLIAVLVSALITFFILKPVYESYTTIMVGKPKQSIISQNNTITYQEVQTNRLLVSTYGEIAKSRTVLDEVIKNLNLNTTPDLLKNKVNVSLVKDTEIIQIKVQDNDPQKAALLSNEIAKTFARQVVKIMNIENVQIIDEAVPNYNPIKPRPFLNITLSFILGLMLGVFVVFILEYLDTSVKTPEDIEKYLGLPVLGIIPDTEKGEVA